jgi:hypothetical protein
MESHKWFDLVQFIFELTVLQASGVVQQDIQRLLTQRFAVGGFVFGMLSLELMLMKIAAPTP